MKNKIKPFRLSIGAYLATLVCIIIVAIATLFAFYTIANIKNLVNGYESDTYKLRYTLSTILIQSVKDNLKDKNFSASNKILETFKRENLLTYFYLKNNDTNKVILGEENFDTNSYQRDIPAQDITMELENYTVYFGIPKQTNAEKYYGSFFEVMANALLLFAIIALFASTMLSSIISNPLKKLSKAAKEITDGNFDVRIKNSNFSEINDLIYSYNEMGFQLSELYSSLELKVQERTIALEEANYKLQETQAMMVHSEKMRSLGELVAGIAHEINNPVNFIHGNIMILQNYADDLIGLIDEFDKNKSMLPQDAQNAIEKIKKEIDLDFLRDDIKDLIKSCIEGTQRTKNIVLDLKNFSRMEEMVLTQFDIPKEIDTTLNILNNKYKNRIEVIKNYEDNLPKIEAYGGQLNQVFMNILDNAQDAMGDTGKLTINAYKEDKNVKIEFIDTGSGIPEENLKKVFDPFFTTKTVGKGTGLGMSISYRVINDHKGKIEVDSKVGEGTKFTITLPIVHETSEKSVDEEIINDLREENGVV